MKIDTSEIKKGAVLKIDGELYKVYDISHTHMGRGGATYNYKVKGVVSGKNNTFTYKSGTVLEGADLTTNNAVYLYKSGDTYSFMENDSGEIYDVDVDVVGDMAGYLKENLDCFLQKYNDNVINILLPAAVSYIITNTVPGIKGDRAQAGKKPATIETGMEIQVPLHKNEGDVVTVNIQTGTVS